jgi:hypothetical protein
MGLGSGIRNWGSGKNLFRIPDPRVKKTLDPGSTTLQKMKKNVINKKPRKIAREKTLNSKNNKIGAGGGLLGGGGGGGIKKNFYKKECMF